MNASSGRRKGLGWGRGRTGCAHCEPPWSDRSAVHVRTGFEPQPVQYGSFALRHVDTHTDRQREEAGALRAPTSPRVPHPAPCRVGPGRAVYQPALSRGSGLAGDGESERYGQVESPGGSSGRRRVPCKGESQHRRFESDPGPGTIAFAPSPGRRSSSTFSALNLLKCTSRSRLRRPRCGLRARACL